MKLILKLASHRCRFHFQLPLCIHARMPSARSAASVLPSNVARQRCTWHRRSGRRLGEAFFAFFLPVRTNSFWFARTSGRVSVDTTKTSPLSHTDHEICRRWSWPISILWLPRRTWAQSDTPNTSRSPDREGFLRKKISEEMQ